MALPREGRSVQSLTRRWIASLLAVAMMAAMLVLNGGTVANAWDSGDTAPTKTLAGNLTLLDNPQGMALDAQGRLYIANKDSDSVTMYAADWASGDTAPVRTLAGGSTGISSPEAVVVASDGTMYVANSASITVYAADWSGNTSPTKTLSGVSTGLSIPSGVALDSTGALYVANYGSDSVGSWAAGWATGNTAPTRQLSGESAGLDAPNGITVDGSDNLYVASFFGDSIQMFAQGWVTGAAPNKVLTGAGTDVSRPTGVAVDSTGNMYVSNVFQNKVNLYLSGWTASSTPTKTLVGGATGLNSPEGVASDSAGNLVVANGGNSVTFYSGGGSANVLTFTQPAAAQLDDSPVALSASATSNLVVSFTSETPLICTVSGATAVLVDTGDCTITASQGGNAIYSPATPIQRTFEVTGSPQVAPLFTSGGSASAVQGSAMTVVDVTTSGTPVVTAISQGAAFGQTGLPAGVSFIDDGDGTARLTGTPTQVGSFTTTFTATNGVNPDATQVFTLTVSAAPVAPLFTSGASASAVQGSAMTVVDVTTSGTPVVTAISQGAAFGQTGLPAGVSFIDDGDGTARLTGTPTQVGSFTTTFTATNGVNPDATQVFTLTVSAAPVAPKVTGMAVSWEAPSIAVSGYRVEYSATGESWRSFSSGECVSPVLGTSCFATVADGLKLGNHYYFRIYSISTEGVQQENGATTEDRLFVSGARSATRTAPVSVRGAKNRQHSVTVARSVGETWSALNNPYQLCLSDIGESIGCKEVLSTSGYRPAGSQMNNSSAQIRVAGIVNGVSFNQGAAVSFSKKTKRGKLPYSLQAKIYSASSLGSTTTTLTYQLVAKGPHRTTIVYKLAASGTGLVAPFTESQNSPTAQKRLGRSIFNAVTGAANRDLSVKLARLARANTKGSRTSLVAKVSGAQSVHGTVTFWERGAALCNARVKNGRAVCRVTLSSPIVMKSSRGDVGPRKSAVSATLVGQGSTGGEKTLVVGSGSRSVYVKR